jgi:hypothetical protein
MSDQPRPQWWFDIDGDLVSLQWKALNGNLTSVPLGPRDEVAEKLADFLHRVDFSGA